MRSSGFLYAAAVCGLLYTGSLSAQLPPVIPIFPLEPTMLFPHVDRPLHIFEARYRTMVADALKGDRRIGMVTLKPGFEADYAGRPPIYEIGCMGEIADVEELPGGRFNIVLRGIMKFRVVSEDQTRPYRLARVEWLPEALNDDERAGLKKLRVRLEELITRGGDSEVSPDMTDEALVNMVAQYLPLPHPERQALLELQSVVLRARTLVELIESKTARPRLLAMTRPPNQLQPRSRKITNNSDAGTPKIHRRM